MYQQVVKNCTFECDMISFKMTAALNRTYVHFKPDTKLAPLRYMSRVMRKPDFCLCENKGADQLRSNCEADQRLCFRYTDSTLSLLIKSEISSFYAASGTVHVGLCRTWSETPKTGFLASRLIYELLVSPGKAYKLLAGHLITCLPFRNSKSGSSQTFHTYKYCC